MSPGAAAFVSWSLMPRETFANPVRKCPLKEEELDGQPLLNRPHVRVCYALASRSCGKAISMRHCSLSIVFIQAHDSGIIQKPTDLKTIR